MSCVQSIQCAAQQQNILWSRHPAPGAALTVKKKKMTKAKRAAAQEGVSAFEVELIQRQASV